MSRSDADIPQEVIETQESGLPRRTLPAIASSLLGLGLVFGSSALWPDVLDAFGVSDGLFGLLGGLGLVLSFPVLLFGSRLTERFTKFALLLLSVALIASATFGFGLATGSVILFAIILLVRGLGISLLDLTANALAMDVERLSRRHVMGPLHAMFNVGTILGAVVVAVALALSFGYQEVYLFFGLLLVGIAAYTLPLRTYEPPSLSKPDSSSYSIRDAAGHPLVRRAALLLAFAFAGEIIVLDWLALYLEDERGSAGSYAAICLGVFGAAMLVGRVANGKALHALGVRKTLTFQGLLAIAGGLMIVFGDSSVAPLVGCAVAGMGLSGVGPTALSISGFAMPGRASAAAGTTLAIGYLGFTCVPIVGGLLAEAFSTRATMAILVVTGAGIMLAVALLPASINQLTVNDSAS